MTLGATRIKDPSLTFSLFVNYHYCPKQRVFLDSKRMSMARKWAANTEETTLEAAFTANSRRSLLRFSSRARLGQHRTSQKG
jgi:hypothetical protein